MVYNERRTITRASTGEGNKKEQDEATRSSKLVSLAIFFFRLAQWFTGQGRHEEAEEAQQKARDILKDA